jgi:hypothetical protein
MVRHFAANTAGAQSTIADTHARRSLTPLASQTARAPVKANLRDAASVREQQAMQLFLCTAAIQ